MTMTYSDNTLLIDTVIMSQRGQSETVAAVKEDREGRGRKR